MCKEDDIKGTKGSYRREKGRKGGKRLSQRIGAQGRTWEGGEEVGRQTV